MGDIAIVTVVGNITKDAQITPKESDPGQLKIDFTLASSYYAGSDQRPKGFYNVRMWTNRDRWSKISQFFSRGNNMLVSGELKPRTDEQGRTWLNIEGSVTFTPLGGGQGQDNKPQQQQQQQQQYQQPQYQQPASAPPGAGGYAQPQAPPPAPPSSRYKTDPSYPGWYQDTQTGQWLQGNPPAPQPPNQPSNTPPPATPPPGYGTPPGTSPGAPPF